MILVFHASEGLLSSFANIDNERSLVSHVISELAQYQLATRVKHSELDIAFAATGGPTAWVTSDNMSVDFTPLPSRPSVFGDVLVEMSNGFVNLSTPAGFIPLVDVIEFNGELRKKQLN